MDMINQKMLHRLILILILISLLGCEQARVDAQMEALCKLDGGMKIYEKVVLPKEQFTEHGGPIFKGEWDRPNKRFQFFSKNHEYTYFNKFEQLKVQRPSYDILTWNHANVSKSTMVVIREADKKLLGTYIYYIRVGGAILPRLGPDPAKNCPQNINENNFLKLIFISAN